MTKSKRIKKLKSQRKNYLPTLFAILILWSALIGIIYFTDPYSFGIIPIAVLLFFLAILFTASTITINTRRGFIIALSSTLFVVLRYFGIGNILNFFLITGIAMAIDLYFTR
ncbi:hypothetical protein ACFL0F_01370 [Patescibacteria group bacterium]